MLEEDLAILLKMKGSTRFLATLLLTGKYEKEENKDDSQEESICNTNEVSGCSSFELWHRKVSNSASSFGHKDK